MFVLSPRGHFGLRLLSSAAVGTRGDGRDQGPSAILWTGSASSKASVLKTWSLAGGLTER